MQNPQASVDTNSGNVAETYTSGGSIGTSTQRDEATDRDRSTLGEKVRGIASQAQDKAGEQVRSGVDAGKMRAAGALHEVAQSLLGGDQIQGSGIGGYIREAGEQVRRAADFLENTDARDLASRTEEYARRQPALFLGGAFAIGLIAARFLKSSRRNTPTGTTGGFRDVDSPFGHDVASAAHSDRERPVRPYREPMPSSSFGSIDSDDASRAGRAF